MSFLRALPSRVRRRRVGRALPTIHHLACTGGTIMSQAVAVQPGVVLLSEISPTAGSLHFNPFDPLQQLIANHVAPGRLKIGGRKAKDLEIDVMADRLRTAHRLVSGEGRALVVRDHSHSDFVRPHKPKRSSRLLQAVEGAHLTPRPILTLRDPVDAWISTVRNGWTAGTKDFDDYCARTLQMARALEGAPVFRYEDFCRAPADVAEGMCDALGVAFDPAALDAIGEFKLTGASGRKSSGISPRTRQDVPDDLQAEIGASRNYAAFMERFYA